MKNKPKVQIGARISMYIKTGLLMRAEMLNITISDLIGDILCKYVEDLTTEKLMPTGRIGQTELRSILFSFDIYERELLEYEKLLLPKKSKKATKR